MQKVTRQGTLGLALLFTLLLGGPLPVRAQLYVYPNKGQNSEQHSRDRYECPLWAVKQTGVDPTQTQTAQSPPPPPPSGGVFRGAARDAAVGAVGGAIAGDAGEGAAIVAATGGLIGGMRRRDQAMQQQQAHAQQSAALSAYNRALSACLSGRGYTVK